MDFVEQIKRNNAGHVVGKSELDPLLLEAGRVYAKHFDGRVWFERSIFTNWTCGIADCKYCYLSTKPKHKAGTDPVAVRSAASVLAEVLLCKVMGWKIGYITGGLRVESISQLVSLLDKIEKVYGEKIMMNYGPYAKSEVLKLKGHLTGMGSAIESFDEELHNFICPSKPLRSLMMFLGHLRDEEMEKLITIILGIGERKEDVDIVIEKVKEFGIDKVQLCFLKPQDATVFSSVPAPNPEYMAWWIAQLRVACPELIIKVALVRERIDDTSLYLRAGANCFSRFMIFKDFAGENALALERECELSGRELLGNFSAFPSGVDEKFVDGLLEDVDLDSGLKEEMKKKFWQYWKKLEKLSEKKKEI